MPNASEARPDKGSVGPVEGHTPHFDVKVQSGARAVRDALAQVRKELQRFDLDHEEEGTVQLVLAEVLNNIVEHAYPPTNPAGPISIKAQKKADGLYVKIRDQGHAMPDGRLPIGAAQTIDVDVPDLPEGGFGWFLIRDLARDITYCRIAHENLLSLRIAVGIETFKEGSPA